MVPNTHRLPSFAIRSVMRTGKRIFHTQLQATVVRTPAQEHWRVAIVVPKSVDARATARNRIKRLISESMRKNMTVPDDVDLVIQVKKGFAPQTQQEVDGVIDEVFKRFA